MSKDFLKLEEQKVDNMLKMNFLSPQNAEFRLTDGGFVAVKVDGKDFGHINIIRTFPLNDADRYLSVRLPDGKQEEIGIIENISDFDEKTQEIISTQLKLRYFMPKVLKILNIKEEFGYTYWTVETDKGKAKFATSSGSAGAVIRYKKGAIIKDADENRYLIEDLSTLSPREMKRIDLYL